MKISRTVVISAIGGLSLLASAVVYGMRPQRTEPTPIEPAIPFAERKSKVLTPDEILQSLTFESLDNRSPTDSRTIELRGTVGPGVTAIDVWSSCDDDTYRIKGFRAGDDAFVYNVSPALGNLCRGENDFVVKTYGKRGNETVMLADKTITLYSTVGIQSRSELPLVRFLDKRTLDQSKSIEDMSIVPIRVPMPDLFHTHCTQENHDAIDSQAPLHISERLAAKYDFTQSGSGTAPRVQITFHERQNGKYVPSRAIPPFPLGGCGAAQDPQLFVLPNGHIAITLNSMNGYASVFNGSTWMPLKNVLSEKIPLLVSGKSIGAIRTIAHGNIIGVVEIDETLGFEYGDPTVQNLAYPDQRGEYLFNADNFSFIGVVWHRKR